MLTNNMDVHTSQSFCQLVEPKLQTMCFREIGLQLRYLLGTKEKAKAYCHNIPEKGQAACLDGASLY
jgi:hypothetical protein